MNSPIEIPEDAAKRLNAGGGDISRRRALEALVAEECRQGRLHPPDLRRLPGCTTSEQIETLLRWHEVWIEYLLEDLERERAVLRRSGLSVCWWWRRRPRSVR